MLVKRNPVLPKSGLSAAGSVSGDELWSLAARWDAVAQDAEVAGGLRALFTADVLHHLADTARSCAEQLAGVAQSSGRGLTTV